MPRKRTGRAALLDQLEAASLRLVEAAQAASAVKIGDLTEHAATSKEWRAADREFRAVVEQLRALRKLEGTL